MKYTRISAGVLLATALSFTLLMLADTYATIRKGYSVAPGQVWTETPVKDPFRDPSTLRATVLAVSNGYVLYDLNGVITNSSPARMFVAGRHRLK